ncbi:hypothetical protein ACS0TY_022515 [Phlomoides rotata]
MHNTTFNLEVVSRFGVTGKPSKAPFIICVKWLLPPYGYMKVNVDVGAAGAPGQLTGGGVFRDRFGVFRGCFAASFGVGFAFEAELAAAFTALELASRNIGSRFG